MVYYSEKKVTTTAKTSLLNPESGQKRFSNHLFRALNRNYIVNFCLILYIIVNNFSVMLGRVFVGRNSTKQGLICLTQGHNAMMQVRLHNPSV